VILGINILLWFLATYPHNHRLEHDFAGKRAALQAQLASASAEGQTAVAPSNPANAPAIQAGDTNLVAILSAQLAALDNEEAGLKLRQSFAGHLGRLIEPFIAPLGFDWKMGIGIVSSFAAREVFVSTTSTVYNVGKYDRSEASKTALEKTLRAQKNADGSLIYTPLTALTLMVFYVFALQCVSTVAVVRRETNSWKWPFFQWVYMGALAWGLSFLTVHFGHLAGLR
jgi:ferrous iron transport protein B